MDRRKAVLKGAQRQRHYYLRYRLRQNFKDALRHPSERIIYMKHGQQPDAFARKLCKEFDYAIQTLIPE